MKYKIDRKKIQDYTGPITIYNYGLVKINMHVNIRRQPYIRYVARNGDGYGWFTLCQGDYSLNERLNSNNKHFTINFFLNKE